MPALREVIAVLDAAYPPALAEPWDRVGLVCGDPDQPVNSVLVAVDPSPEVVAEATAGGFDLLLVHHPLLLHPVSSIAGDTAKGRVLHDLIRAGCALFTAHTNADAAPGGVNDALCAAIGVTPERALDAAPLVAQPPGGGAGPATPLVKVTVFVPGDHVEPLIDALSAAGAGSLGGYDRCAYLVDGTGTFLPGPDASPAIGVPGEIEQVGEVRVEMVLPWQARHDVVRAVRAVHPYEVPAFDLVPLLPIDDPANSAADGPIDGAAGGSINEATPAALAPPAEPMVGIGRIGVLDEPVSVGEFAERIAAALPSTHAGVHVAGDLNALVERVAVCSGAGDSLLATAAAADVDAYVTADLRHHPASEAIAGGGPHLIGVSHWASEWPWCPVAADVLTAAFGDSIEVTVSTRRTDPWQRLITAHERHDG